MSLSTPEPATYCYAYDNEQRLHTCTGPHGVTYYHWRGTELVRVTGAPPPNLIPDGLGLYGFIPSQSKIGPASP